MILRIATPLVALMLASCEREHASPAPLDERQDVATLQAALTEDPAQLVLDEVDDAVARQRPVIAADLIGSAAIPAVRRHMAMLQELELHTSAGHTLRARVTRLERAQVTALEHWRDALARGIGHDDEVLLDAMHEYGQTQRELAAFHAELAAIRPPETGVAPPTDRAGVLEGLPSLEPPSSGASDETDTPAEPDPHGADPIDGTEDTSEPPSPPSLRGPHEPELPGDVEDHHAIAPHRPTP